MTYSVDNIDVETQIKLGRWYSTVTTGTVSGSFTQSLTYSNTYVFNLSASATFSYSNPSQASYTFLVNAGSYTFNVATGSLFKSSGGTAVGLTGSFVISGVYDGTIMWHSTPATNFITRT